MFSQIAQLFSHISRTRLTAFILMLALPIAARAQTEPVITIESSPTSVMEGKQARFIISAVPAPTRNLRVNIEVTSGGPVLPNNYTPPTTITVGTSGRATMTVPTVDFTENPDDKNWGSVHVRIKEGNGYTIGEHGSASVQVIDEDATAVPTLTLHADRTRAAVGDVVTVTIRRTEPYDRRHRVDIRMSGHLGYSGDDDVDDWEPIVEILHPASHNRHPMTERSLSITVWPEKNCARTQGRRIEAYLFDAYYYGDNLLEGTGDVEYKVGDPSSITIDVYYPSNRQPTGAPTISYSGDLEENTILTADVSNIQDADGLNNVSYTYQWYRVASGSATQIPNATNSTYDVVAADNGFQLKVSGGFHRRFVQSPDIGQRVDTCRGWRRCTSKTSRDNHSESHNHHRRRVCKIHNHIDPCTHNLTECERERRPDRHFHQWYTPLNHHLQRQPENRHTDSQYRK